MCNWHCKKRQAEMYIYNLGKMSPSLRTELRSAEQSSVRAPGVQADYVHSTKRSVYHSVGDTIVSNEVRYAC